MKILKNNILKLGFILLFILPSCQNKDAELTIKAKELELKEKELDLQTKNLDFKQQTYLDSINNLKELTSSRRSLSELYEKNKEAVFFITTAGSEASYTGSGFFVREDGLAVSNFHVFANAEMASIETYDGREYMISQIVEYNEELDFILFKINNVNNERFKTVLIALNEPKVGEDCFAIGNPLNLKSTLSKGIVSGIRNDFIQTTAQITHGSSGGALFNDFGEVIGITTKGHKDADLNFALNIVGVDFQNVVLNSYISRVTSNDNGYNKNSSLELTFNERSRIEGVLKMYYDNLHSKNYNQQYYMYAETLTRCYNKMNLSREQVIDEQKSYNKTYPYQKTEITSKSIDIAKDYDGHFNVNFRADFYIAKESWKEYKKFNVDMFFVFDSNYKIKAVYSNIN